ncbi:MAG: cell wall metabolism sensor histidine kinase WalK, partial [Firmicutes bacterium]|nr:cell wall metabolism sensor histidine kinase WalK [Bacillota bacterium]
PEGSSQLAAVTAQVLGLLEGNYKSRDIRMQLNLPADLPALAMGEEFLQQVLLNLLDNAIKYSPPGEEVQLRAQVMGSRVWVEVADKGLGIPAESLPRVFERFYRVDVARSRREGGTGLGLAIVKHLVEAHGGKVWVESQPGQGSTFFFSIPAVRTKANPEGSKYE